MALVGLLLDSGDTLLRPRGGRWNPRFDFEQVVSTHHPAIAPASFPPAIAVGDEYLKDWPAHEARLGHVAARAEYHRTILEALGVPLPTRELLDELDRPLPFGEIVEPFADTAEGIAALRSDGWRLAIVADTSPLMEEVYEELGLHSLIETFVISGALGFTKPDPRMYRTASDRLGLAPEQCVFVDDNRENLRGAASLGYRVCGMSRYGEPPEDGAPWVRDLGELRRHLAELRSR